MIKSQHIYSPQAYLEAVTGKYYFINGEDAVDFIQEVLVQNGYTDELWDYPLTEIEHIVENNLNVVLVNCSYYDGDMYINEYRWFEVPEDFVEEV